MQGTFMTSFNNFVLVVKDEILFISMFEDTRHNDALQMSGNQNSSPEVKMKTRF